MEIKQVKKELREIEVVVERQTICDWCGKEIVKNTYDAFECEVNMKTGFNYPEGGSGEEKTVDLCSGCAEKLFAHMKELGIKVQEKEWDW